MEPSAEELATMQKGNYLLHARNGKLTKVQAEKNRLPLDPKGHAQVTYTAQSPKDKNTIYVNQGSYAPGRCCRVCVSRTIYDGKQ